ncbi:hypothetical protein BaRGS_00037133, partial [Batillaria attramentaria]
CPVFNRPITTHFQPPRLSTHHPHPHPPISTLAQLSDRSSQRMPSSRPMATTWVSEAEQ